MFQVSLIYLCSIEQPNNHTFAVKLLCSKKRSDFDKEVEILKNIDSDKRTHPHLITLLATYEQIDRFNLIFPYAPRDLESYWKHENPEPRKSNEMILWLIDQCQGLAAGLATIHRYGTLSENAFLNHDPKPAEATANDTEVSDSTTTRWYHGRHGDIKPKNILWFPEGSYGILKITDFGIAHFTVENKVLARKNGRVPNSLTYRSPECDDPEGLLSGMCDVWALGCVYLVFITWYIGGHTHIENFAHKRLAIDHYWQSWRTDTFFTIEGGVARVKSSVINVSHYPTAQSLKC